MEDRSILALLNRRSEQALAALSEKFGQRLLALAMNILGNREDAQECVNDTYLALWDTIPPKAPDPLWPYACRVGKNIALSRLRKNTAHKRGGYALSLEELSECLGEDMLQQTLDAKALGRAIDGFLDRQTKENRILFVRRYWFGDSVGAIAKARGLSESAVSVRLSRIKSKLKDYLKKEGFYEP